MLSGGLGRTRFSVPSPTPCPNHENPGWRTVPCGAGPGWRRLPTLPHLVASHEPRCVRCARSSYARAAPTTAQAPRWVTGSHQNSPTTPRAVASRAGGTAWARAPSASSEGRARSALPKNSCAEHPVTLHVRGAVLSSRRTCVAWLGRHTARRRVNAAPQLGWVPPVQRRHRHGVRDGRPAVEDF